MSEECKRGAPTEDGVYHILCSDGWQGIATKDGDVYRSSQGDPFDFGRGVTVMAHRPQFLLSLPQPLVPLRIRNGMPCVVRISEGSDPLYAERYDGNIGPIYMVHTVGWITPKQFDHIAAELTRAECEAAGYEWPIPGAQP